MTQYAQYVLAKPERVFLQHFRPTPDEDKYISDAMAFLVMTSPLFAHVLYAEMDIRHTKYVPYAATDARSIFVNVSGMRQAGWGIEEVAFVLAHEVFHYVYGDLISGAMWRANGTVGTRSGSLPYHHATMNKAMDYRINAALIEGRVGKFPTIGLFDKDLSAVGMESCVEIYEKIFQNNGGTPPPDQPGRDPGNYPIEDHGGFDQHIDAPEDEVRNENGTGPALRDATIAAALEACKGQGDLPAALRRLIGEIQNPTVRWQDHLSATMKRSAGEPGHDWSKPNKRLISRPDKIVFARRVNYGCGLVVVGWDTSGSTHQWKDKFFSEMAGIVADLNPRQLIVIRCDAKVHGYDDLEEVSDLNQYREQVNEEGVGGGGGTKFEPVFERIREEGLEPDMLVYLTDMLGSFPTSEPDYPVIWANILPGRQAPFGHVVDIRED